MIIGIGHDLTDITRISKVLNSRMGSRFLDRVLTIEEKQHAESLEGARLAQFTSGRFAAKEAVVKAFGCGIGHVVGFTDIEILPNSCGKPECRLSEGAWDRLGLRQEDVRIHVTITHERTLASAFAVIERWGVVEHAEQAAQSGACGHSRSWLLQFVHQNRRNRAESIARVYFVQQKKSC